MAPQEKVFLQECLRVRRERGLPTQPHSPETQGRGRSGRARWFGCETLWARPVPVGAHFSMQEDHLLPTSPFRGLRMGELIASTAALQAREKETTRRVSKLEQKALSSAKVAAEFQRLWTGITIMAEKTNQELKKARGEHIFSWTPFSQALPRNSIETHIENIVDPFGVDRPLLTVWQRE